MKQLSYKDQRGLTRFGLIITIALVLLLALIIANIVKHANKTKQDNNGTAVSCDYKDADLCKFFTNKKGDLFYTVTAVSESNGTKTNSVLKVAGNDRYYLKVDGQKNYEIIVIGTTMHTKTADGKWWKQTVSEADAQKYKNEALVALPEPSDNVQYKKDKKEACGNQTCFKYQKTDGSKITTYLWFDDSEYRLRRVQQSMDSKKYDGTYNYEKVTVEAPETFTELQPGQTLTPGQSAPSGLPKTGDDPVSDEENARLMERYRQNPSLYAD
jgi:hypothetical protein